MRLWQRISRFSSDLLSRLEPSATYKSAWRPLRGGRRKTTTDPETALIRDLTTKGAPMSLASVKAALDATAATQDSTASKDSTTSKTIIDRLESLRAPTIGPFTKFV